VTPGGLGLAQSGRPVNLSLTLNACLTDGDLHAISDVFFFLQNCVAQTEVFHASKGGAEQMAKDMQVPFLGRVPLDPLLSRAAEEGRSAFGTSSSKGAEEDRSASLLEQFPICGVLWQDFLMILVQLSGVLDLQCHTRESHWTRQR